PLYFTFSSLAPPVIYSLSLHDALPICLLLLVAEGCGLFEILRLDSSFLFQPNFFYVFLDILYIGGPRHGVDPCTRTGLIHYIDGDRKSTRLNSSHLVISYAVFCLKKKK